MVYRKKFKRVPARLFFLCLYTIVHLFGKFLEISDLVGVGARSHQMGNSLGISDLVLPPFQIQPLLIDT